MPVVAGARFHQTTVGHRLVTAVGAGRRPDVSCLLVGGGVRCFGRDLVDPPFEFKSCNALDPGISERRQFCEQCFCLGTGSRIQRRFACTPHRVQLLARPSRDALYTLEQRIERYSDNATVPVTLHPECDFGSKLLDLRLVRLVTVTQRVTNVVNRVDPFRPADAGGRSHGVSQARPYPRREWSARMKQELEHPVRVYRLPHQCERELEYLRGSSKTSVSLEPAPRQSSALKRVVENDAIVLGDQERAVRPR